MNSNLKYVIVLRHGQYDSSSENGSLTDEGREQIEAAAHTISSFLPPRSTVFVVSSPYMRAVESAQIIAGTFKVVAQICSSLGNGSFEAGVEASSILQTHLKGEDV